MITVRNSTLEDAKRLCEIYDYYVKNTAISFEWTTPSVEEFKQRMNNIMNKYPYLVVCNDDKIEGYACAKPFVGRAAYDWACELTIYLDFNARKLGMGRKLYEALENALKEMGILNMYACIGYPNNDDEYLTSNSADFHAHMGFKKVGEFYNCGHKFNRWYNMIWMEKIIGEHIEKQPPLKGYKDICK